MIIRTMTKAFALVPTVKEVSVIKKIILEIDLATNGRLKLPAQARECLGLQNGGVLRAEKTVEGFILRPVDQAINWAQGIARKYVSHPVASSTEFTTNRITNSGE
jgi:bifunctional DNA-binding transcriptional regulator/antitoxin component of YhaV-PrlF toxin-antitoxin module